MTAGLASRAPALSAGVLTADLTRLGAELEQLRGKAAWAHVDVMDGVDGGVTIANAAEVASWGIDVIVSGSAIFDRIDPAGNLDLLTRQLLLTTQEVPDGKR
jgi:pentose-5-phosphate-3-epimerase